MKKHIASALFLLTLLSALINAAYAADESFIDQFIGSPLIILVAIIVIDVIAFIYHKIRK